MSGMETDGFEPSLQDFASGSGNNDVQSLLQQFNCLGTTDHEELIGQMLQILGFEIGYSTARFFLDMNNWNLQAAVGCYFDANRNQKLPSMQLAINSTPESNTQGVLPNAKFTHSWEVQNTGDEPWPWNCFLKIVSLNGENVDTSSYINLINNNNNNLSDFHRVNLVESCVQIRTLLPSRLLVLKVDLFSPPTLGPFQAKFRLCTPNGNFFGEMLTCDAQVVDQEQFELMERLKPMQAIELHPQVQFSNDAFVFGPVQEMQQQPSQQQQPPQHSDEMLE